MTSSKEMFMSRLEGEPVGPTPLFLRDLTLGLDAIDVRTTDVFKNPYDADLSAKAVIAFQRKTGQDAVVGCIHSAAFNIESFGGVMKYPEYGIPTPLSHPLQGVCEVRSVHDLQPCGKTLGAIESYRLVRSALPEVAVVANVEGPMTKAGVLMETANMALQLQSDPSFVEEVIELAMEHTIVQLERMDEDGSIDCVFLAAATDNPDLLGPSVYSSVSLKWLRRVVTSCHGLGYPVIFHPHGVFSTDEGKPLLEETLATGIDGFQFAEGNDPSIISRSIGRRCATLGGTDVVPTLVSGRAEDIRSETARYMDACSGERYVFMCSCSLHRGTSMDNIGTMITAMRGRGKGKEKRI